MANKFPGRLDHFIRVIFRLVVYITGTGLVVLGAHGLYVYFSRLSVLFGASIEKLFFEIPLPLQLSKVVEWFSVKGFESWFVPVVSLLVGALLWWQEEEIEYFIFRKIPNIFRYK
jgi:hypothetical protein